MKAKDWKECYNAVKCVMIHRYVLMSDIGKDKLLVLP